MVTSCLPSVHQAFLKMSCNIRGRKFAPKEQDSFLVEQMNIVKGDENNYDRVASLASVFILLKSHIHDERDYERNWPQETLFRANFKKIVKNL